MDAAELKRILDDLSGELGFSHFGWTRFERPLHFDIYRQWLAEGLHGEMEYLQRHLPLKEDPTRFSPRAVAAIAFAFPYRPHPAPSDGFPLKAARIASYATGGDYHHWMKDRLRSVSSRLREFWPTATFEVHTDSSPISERDFAARAGLGWIGRNGCLIDRRHGSFFLLGEILSDVDLPQDPTFEPLPDFCGTCRRCLDACPTSALLESRTMDARRCISYLSIESRSVPPTELRSAWGDWLFGCDICQSVCPWNAKPFRPAEAEKLPLRPAEDSADNALTDELRWILTASGKRLEKAFAGTAMARAGAFGLKRNALIVTANRRLPGLRTEVSGLLTHERLGELAAWTLSHLPP